MKPLLCVYSAVVLVSVIPVFAEPFSETKDVAFTAKFDGSTQHYVVMLPGAFSPEEPHHALIALHGHGSDRWQFPENPRDECRAARDVAVRHDMIFVSPDYRAETSWMGPSAEADMVQIIQELRATYTVDKVFLCGGSMGGSSALTFAALHPDLVAGVASMNGTANHLEYDNFQDAIRASFGGTKQEIPGEYKKRSAEYWPERFTMPVGITASGKDESVPPQSVLRLGAMLEKLGHDVLVIYREDAGHVTGYEDGVAIIEFVIETSLKGRAAPIIAE
jgi:pimeloyl-ACP methyl ester carboxylesterase